MERTERREEEEEGSGERRREREREREREKGGRRTVDREDLLHLEE
jgi:hypothetical protein